jgi:hypothetical protein
LEVGHVGASVTDEGIPSPSFRPRRYHV